MTNGQTAGSGSPMEEAAENAGGVSGMMKLTINLPDNVRISTVATDEEEMTVSNGNTTGMIQIYAGSSAPDGWLLCNGAAVSRATYADLFAVIGTVYGVGNANTTFNLPDLRGRFPLGKDDMGGVSADRVAAAEADVLGSSGGAEKHTLTVAEMPEHEHRFYNFGSGRNGGGTWGITSDRIGRAYDHGSKPSIPTAWPPESNNSPILGSGGDEAHNNLPPWQTLNYIIKT